MENGANRQSRSIFGVWKMEQIDGRDPFSEFGKWSKSSVKIHFISLENGANQWLRFVEEVYLQW